jgi:hypothetical protein
LQHGANRRSQFLGRFLVGDARRQFCSAQGREVECEEGGRDRQRRF